MIQVNICRRLAVFQKTVRLKVNAVRGKSFTLIELVVVIAALGIFAALLIQAAEVVTEAKTIACMGNLQKIGIAVHTYAENHNGHIEGLTGESGYQGTIGLPWSQNIHNILKDPKIFLCPADITKNDRRGNPKPAKSSYGVVKISPSLWPVPFKSFTIDRLTDPAKFLHIMDSHSSWNNIGYASGSWQVTSSSKGGYMDKSRVAMFASHEGTISAALHYNGSVRTYRYPETAKNFPPSSKAKLFFE